jgi:hypothetical protein
VDPITIGLQVVGMGMQLFGGLSAAGEAKHQAEISQQIAGNEQQINLQKQQQMQLEARRQQMETFRNVQRARAQATNAAVSQGAQFGSGLMGGLDQLSDSANNSLRNVDQNKQISQNIFGYNNQISSEKAQISASQGSQATDQAWASMGGTLVKDAGTIGGLGKDLTSSMKFNSGGMLFQS